MGGVHLPKAFVVKKADAGELREKDVAEWLDKKVAPSKRLRGGVQFVEAIPKSASGKILRRLVKQQHREEPSDGHHQHPFPGGAPAKL
jgi:acyl-coenzyme A synthetase/AMP-(fatty) acid ligase